MCQVRLNKIVLGPIVLCSIFYLYIHQSNTIYQFNLSEQNHSNAQVRIYCLILTSPKYFDTRARAVNSTWAKRCDRYSFISESSNDTKGLPIAPLSNITPGFQYVYEHFVNDYDWVVKADDDTYLFVENLKSFLKEQNTSEPITFGYNFKIKASGGFHGGGAGYVLSREAVKRFYSAHQNPNTTCVKDGGPEDVEIAKCLRTVGVYPGKSVDEHNHERFHHLSFKDHFRGQFANWFLEYAENKPLAGLDCCSNTTISFHYVTPDEQYLIEHVRYRFHGNK